MSKIISRLERISLFKHFTDDSAALEKIASLIKPKTYKPGTYIIREGENGNAMYILNRGSVRIEKQTLAADPYTVVNLKEDMNVFFGEVALMDNDVRSASVIALTPVECYVLRKEDFERLGQTDPKIGYEVIREIAKSLAGRLRKTTADSAALIAALIDDETPGGTQNRKK